MLFDHWLDDSHRQFADICRRFAREEIAPHAEQWEEQGGFDRDLYVRAAEAGVLGILPGVVGLLEAVETLKILLGLGDLLVGRGWLSAQQLEAVFSNCESLLPVRAAASCVCGRAEEIRCGACCRRM